MNTEILICEDPLFLEPLTIKGCGAIARFDGIVRGEEDGTPIDGLHYEAYSPMAEMLIEEILKDLSRVHPFAFVRIHHRIGFVPAGEAAIMMDVHSRHRAEGFFVLQKFMDRLKQDVPIWKHCGPL